MANDLRTESESSVTSLVTGIINDAQRLIEQQLKLFREEIREDLHKTKEASTFLGVGLAVCFLGAMALVLMVPLLLSWVWPALPLWGSFAIVGGVLALVGGGLVYTAVKQFESFNPLPDQSVEGLKENVQWQTNRR